MLATIQNQRKEPELSDFTKFVDNETLIVSDPLLSKGKVDKFLGKIPTQKRNKISTFGTREQNKKGDLSICINGNKNHKLQKCKEFMGKNLKDIIKFLLQQK